MIKEEPIEIDSDTSPIKLPAKRTRQPARKITYVLSDSEGDASEEFDVESEESEDEFQPKKAKKEVKPRVKKETKPKVVKKKVKIEKPKKIPKPKDEKIKKEPRKKVTAKQRDIKSETKMDIVKPEPSSVKSDSRWDNNWNLSARLSEKENVPYQVANSLINLFESGDTIPFIARYRKAITNDMPAEKLREVKESYEEICACRKKADNIINAIKKTGNFNSAINDSILKCRNMEELEFVYAPFKTGQKRTLAERAKQLGLEESAMKILRGGYVNIDTMIDGNKEGLRSREEVEKGLMHIIAHVVTSETDTLEFIRKLRQDLRLTLESKKSSKELKPDDKKFENYFEFKIPLQYIKPHQILAINRGENLKILSVKLNVPDFAYKQFLYFIYKKYRQPDNKEREKLLQMSIDDAYKRKVQPLIIRQTRAELNAKAEKASVDIFAVNLKKLLLVSPLKGKVIMGIDPGFKIGCKVAVISELGEILDTSVIYPHTSSSQKDPLIIKNLLQKHGCSLIAIGNGTACRETEKWFSDLIKTHFFSPLDVSYTIVDECGASIYSCSPEAKKEFPDLDPLLISAGSLARRVQDPLAEMVKVDPQHLGVGMYQHDVNKKLLENTLNEIVSECVSFVGVDLNTASQCLLRRVAGLTDLRATAILKYRSTHGPFTNRYQIKDVKGIGDKIFEQCAGFLRVGPSNKEKAKEFYERPDANPLDCTWIHPESYELTEKIIDKFGLNIKDVGQKKFIEEFSKCLALNSAKSLSEEFSSPESTIQLILDALKKPFDYDLRTEGSHKSIFRKEVTSINDLAVDMTITGHVRNVTSFGAFVDIGVGTNGLIHQSAMRGFNVQLGDKVECKILNLEINRQRIGLGVVNII